MEAVFRGCVEDERQARGAHVLLSSHILTEVEALCDRVTIIRAGRTVDTGTLADLRHLTRTSITASWPAARAGSTGRAGVHDLDVDGHARLRCQVDTNALEEVHAPLTAVGVRSLASQPPTLEELFLRHYAVDGRPRRRAGQNRPTPLTAGRDSRSPLPRPALPAA